MTGSSNTTTPAISSRRSPGAFVSHLLNCPDQKFCPEKILMVPETGRVYHPGPDLAGGVGLISDRLSILWSQEQRFIFNDGESEPPSGFVWEEREIPLDNSLLELVVKDRERGIGFLM